MAIGETLLKTTQIPFAYSIILLFFRIMNIDYGMESIIAIIGIGSILGTGITILDPVGMIFRQLLTNQSVKRPNKIERDFIISAINTRSIKFEIDKLTSISYFILILVISLCALFSGNFVYDLTYDTVNNFVCDIDCTRTLMIVFICVILIIVIVVLYKNFMKIPKNIIFVSRYQYGINSEFVTDVTLQSIARSIEQNDWAIVEKWAKQIDCDIKTEKNKREYNMRAMEQVYQPLYDENVAITTIVDNILDPRCNDLTLPCDAWSKIENNIELKLIITDKTTTENIHTLYQNIKEYNKTKTDIDQMITSIIKEEFLILVKYDIRELRCDLINKDNEITSINLIDCLKIDLHPNQYMPKHNFNSIHVTVLDGSDRLLYNHNVDGFDKLWIAILKRYANEVKYRQFKLIELLMIIKNINQKLTPLLHERINIVWSI